MTVDQRIRNLRPPRKYVDPYKANGWLIEEERRPNGALESALTVFLTGAECPFACSFCDLWQSTLEGPTPPGALTHQLDAVLRSLDGPRPSRLKLYNASNFFDRRAVPGEDFAGLASLASGFEAVTVESHATMIGEKAVDFARLLSGKLEVAMGLETVHPVALTQLNKRLDVDRFDRAADFLNRNGIGIRVFVLLGAPHIDAGESIEWTVKTVAHAADRGASFISIIPVRGGNGEMERLQELGQFTPPTLSQLENTLEQSMDQRSAVVTADLWNAERLEGCPGCMSARIERLRRINLTGQRSPRVDCPNCGGA